MTTRTTRKKRTDQLKLSKKILLFAHWLCSVLICAAFFAFLFVPDSVRAVWDSLSSSMGTVRAKILFGVLLAIYAALSAAAICALLGRAKGARRAERGFIDVASGDSGHVRIAVSAIEQMVRQSVHSIDGISEMKIDIENLDDAIGISVNAVIVSGSHVPTLTANMQRAIRQFVELNCGVAVRDIAISINAVTSRQEPGRRIFGRTRSDAARREAPFKLAETGKDAPIEATAPVQAAVDETKADIREEQTEVADQAVELPVTDPEEQTEVYDFERPYESQFEKDLAELKARQAEEAEPGTADGEQG